MFCKAAMMCFQRLLPSSFRFSEKLVLLLVLHNEKVTLAYNPTVGVRVVTMHMRNSKGNFYLRSHGRKESLHAGRLYGLCFVAVWVEPEAKCFPPAPPHYSALCISQPTDVLSREGENMHLEPSRRADWVCLFSKCVKLAKSKSECKIKIFFSFMYFL